MQKVIIITGASGVGKTTVSTYLKQQYQIPAVVTHTTRPKRKHEVDGVDYYFETPSTFRQNEYLESVTYSGHLYGSSKEGLTKAWAKSDVVSIVLDTKGAVSYVQAYSQQAMVWFLTVDEHLLMQRLKMRGDTPDLLAQRLHSKEFRRDLLVPQVLQTCAHILRNDSWPQLKTEVDLLMKSVK
ncbi:guanylate kinase [Bombilactobacillus folatiphilus]|uniref:Guanylate kinase n=1 Tax=Bombilactobacillus folatiphilus TaxID=2923362 RepID=A0ABY4P9M7_9LACO|nr:guanylate kinase [Bombilactobacillus folatiphilus]UQS82236.1 guanylate kinase [Bombilactobacillus folatiphilus]